ncbi:MAG: XrtA/PEP-CTERM system histidine kinase PrsK [Halioglobus sp.]
MEYPELEHQESMLANTGLYSYGAAFLIYTLLCVQVFLTRRNRTLATPLFVASALTALWAGVIALSTILPYPQIKLMQLTELLRNAAWSFLLLRLIGLRLQGSDHILGSSRWIPWFGVGFTLVCAALFAAPYLSKALFGSQDLDLDLGANLIFGIWLALSILGLLLLEQIFRNSNEVERWSNKHLCMGLGILFAYDFFMYAEALLFRELDANLWQARGMVVSMSAIFVAIGSSRIDRSYDQQRLYLSRHVAFHSVTLLAAGLYLMAMAMAGYFIRYLGGSWGGVLQIIFLCGSGGLLVVLLFSGTIRARTRVWLSKNFFSYKYDYRTEWLQFTETLAQGDDNIPETITRGIANLTQSPAGILWTRSEDGQFNLAVNWEMPAPRAQDNLGALPQWMEEKQWIIDLREWREAQDLYENLDLPLFLTKISRAQLIIPLLLGDQLQGILLLRESDLHPKLNWEDRDLLKLAGRQAASHLAQYQAHQALVESRQFEAFNRLSAYVVHDLKNILAQQSLIVSNADKHRDNPAFIDDVFNTVRNSVERMSSLMEQMRSGERGEDRKQVALCALLNEAVNSRKSLSPEPKLTPCKDDLTIEADREQLLTVFTHIIQNAQEATTKTGEVTVRLLSKGNNAIVEVADTGIGMNENFLRTRLFKPFDSTKGLTGMGIGAFESREFVRSLGGDIRVTSIPGEGSVFHIVLPCVAEKKVEQIIEYAVREGNQA